MALLTIAAAQICLAHFVNMTEANDQSRSTAVITHLIADDTTLEARFYILISMSRRVHFYIRQAG